jgi:hypothetical protein
MKGKHLSSKVKKKKKKRTARVICRDGKEFWTTQSQFWQWIRDGVVNQTDDHPATGILIRENEEYMVLFNHTILNLAYPIHISEALRSRRLGLRRT